MLSKCKHVHILKIKKALWWWVFGCQCYYCLFTWMKTGWNQTFNHFTLFDWIICKQKKCSLCVNKRSVENKPYHSNARHYLSLTWHFALWQPRTIWHTVAQAMQNHSLDRKEDLKTQSLEKNLRSFHKSVEIFLWFEECSIKLDRNHSMR